MTVSARSRRTCEDWPGMAVKVSDDADVIREVREATTAPSSAAAFELTIAILLLEIVEGPGQLTGSDREVESSPQIGPLLLGVPGVTGVMSTDQRTKCSQPSSISASRSAVPSREGSN